VTTGIVIFAHGSRVESANEAVRTVAAELARTGGYPHVEAAFLELGEPSLGGAVDRLAAAGLRKVLVIPYFLTPGLHLERDLPTILGEVSRCHTGLEITSSAPLDGHPALVRILLDRVREGLET
jgi:sirohydrochlorin ferrochelatase